MNFGQSEVSTMNIQTALPTYKINSAKQVIIDRETGQYLGQPDSILLDDDQTILTVYPKGHGLGEAVLNKSTDGGLTWQGRMVPNETLDGQILVKHQPFINSILGTVARK